MRASVSVLTAKLDLPVPSGLGPLGHVPKVRPDRRAGYEAAGGTCPLFSRSLASKITGKCSRKTIFQNTNQNTLETPDFDNRQIASFGGFIGSVATEAEISLSGRRNAHRERGFVWHWATPFESMPP
jgi:hypothetical protein